ncbi:MAG: response regulator [Oligoflexia bacterium]|nr:response regulator [Oligoflexia bacterium]
MTALAQKKILIVDDVTFVRNTLREILTGAGYQVVGEAADGAEAVQLYSQLRPDLVTMDVVMPNMSGIDATRKILKGHPGARVVIISAMGQENLVMEAVNVGARDYILKPFTSAEVLTTIDRALNSEAIGAAHVGTEAQHGLS